MKTQVRAAVLTNYFEVARDIGLDTAPLLREVGLSRSHLKDPDQRIAVESAIQLLERSAQVARCPIFGLRMAESRQLSDFGVVSLLISHQATLRDALETTIHYRHLINDALAMQLDEDAGFAILREEVVAPFPARQAMELAIGVLHRMCAALLGDRWKPREVRFTHPRPSDMRLHRRLFGCAIAFEADFNGIVFPRAELDTPNPRADPAMARHAERFVQTLPAISTPSIVRDVHKAIYLMLPSGRATIEHAAQGLGTSVRTLQRQLDQADANFSDLLNDVRRDLAARYVGRTGYAMTRISELLGYTTPSSFTRWFTTQFGMPPIEWRRQAAATEATWNPGPGAASHP